MVDLKLQKKLASQILKCPVEKVLFDNTQLPDIKESITKADIKGMIASGAISIKPVHESSRSRARKTLIQKTKGLRKGHGSRKGTANARLKKRDQWIDKIRKQRALLKSLKEKEMISKKVYQLLANKAKGGYFRSERHLKTYLNEHNLIIKEK